MPCKKGVKVYVNSTILTAPYDLFLDKTLLPGYNPSYLYSGAASLKRALVRDVIMMGGKSFSRAALSFVIDQETLSIRQQKQHSIKNKTDRIDASGRGLIISRTYKKYIPELERPIILNMCGSGQKQVIVTALLVFKSSERNPVFLRYNISPHAPRYSTVRDGRNLSFAMYRYN